MKFFFLFFVVLSGTFEWVNEAMLAKSTLDETTKLTQMKVTKSSRFEIYRSKNCKKTIFCSNNFDVTDTISRTRYEKNNFVFYVREWYVADYQDFGTNPKDFPEGEVYESIYIFKTKNDGILLCRREPYFLKSQVDSLIKTLPQKSFDTLFLNNITYNRIKGKYGKMVHLRFKRDD